MQIVYRLVHLFDSSKITQFFVSHLKICMLKKKNIMPAIQWNDLLLDAGLVSLSDSILVSFAMNSDRLEMQLVFVHGVPCIVYLEHGICLCARSGCLADGQYVYHGREIIKQQPYGKCHHIHYEIRIERIPNRHWALESKEKSWSKPIQKQNLFEKCTKK